MFSRVSLRNGLNVSRHCQENLISHNKKQFSYNRRTTRPNRQPHRQFSAGIDRELQESYSGVMPRLMMLENLQEQTAREEVYKLITEDIVRKNDLFFPLNALILYTGKLSDRMMVLGLE
jgi:hypothetical protein